MGLDEWLEDKSNSTVKYHESSPKSQNPGLMYFPSELKEMNRRLMQPLFYWIKPVYGLMMKAPSGYFWILKWSQEEARVPRKMFVNWVSGQVYGMLLLSGVCITAQAPPTLSCSSCIWTAKKWKVLFYSTEHVWQRCWSLIRRRSHSSILQKRKLDSQI